MPHINRIRVNNVKYNFGTQYYDDFVMRFSGKNTIYDLANGGGKSVLMMLLLQNMLPNSTLDEKQPVEKLFRSGNENQTIHSLVEWKLNSCDVKNGFKFMTTGFCARKGRDNSGEEEGSREISSVEYFNYCIFYREFNDNDMRNLPLNNGKEKITYTGLKAYLKDLEKKDFNLQIYIFERKGDYQRFISQYGVYESEWEVIRGINKTEGHVRTYFETTYRTTRKVVEDLLIEEIIQKSFTNKAATDDNTVQIARTLLDIKDKLVDLAKKKSEINNYENQIQLLHSFIKRLGNLKGTYLERDSIKQRLGRAYITCVRRLKGKKERYQTLLERREVLGKEIKTLNHQIETAMIYISEEELREVEKILNNTTRELEEKEAVYSKMEEDIKIKEGANYYFDYLENKKKYETSMAAIEALSGKNEDLLTELRSMASYMKKYLEEQLLYSQRKLEELEEEQERLGIEDNKLLLQEREFDLNIAVKQNQMKELSRENQQLEESLEELRKKTGLLILDSIDKEIKKKHEQKERVEETLKGVQAKAEGVAKQELALEVKLENAQAGKNKEEESLDKIREFLSEYRSEKTRADRIKEIYNVRNYKELKKAILVRYGETIEKVSDITKRIKEKQARVSSLEQGNLVEQSSYMEELKEYILRYHKENVISGQEYIKTLELDEKKQLLEAYPYLPYSLILEQCFEEVSMDINLRNKDFGNGLIPLLSFKAIKDRKEVVDEKAVFFHLKDSTLFLNKEKIEKEIQNQKKEMEELEKRNQHLKENAEVMAEDLNFISYFVLQFENIYEEKQREYEERKTQTKQSDSYYESILEELLGVQELLKAVKEEVRKTEESEKELEEEVVYLKEMKRIYDKLKQQERSLKVLKDELERQQDTHIGVKSKLAVMGRKLETLGEQLTGVTRKKEILEKQWNEVYATYYMEGVKPFKAYEIRVLEVEFLGKRTAFEQENADVTDKKNLAYSYKNAMEKNIQAIQYGGNNLQELEELDDKNLLFLTKTEELLKAKELLREQKNSVKEIIKRRDKQAEEKNQKLGGITHSKHLVENKYGQLAQLEILPERFTFFIGESQQVIKQTINTLKEEEVETKQAERNIFTLETMKSDMERMLRQEGMALWGLEEEELDKSENLKEIYEKLRDMFEKTKEESLKRKELFNQGKEKLADSLKLLGAFELAEEIKRNMSSPSNGSEIEVQIGSLLKTIECIELEKSRIGKGIEDMQRIKENFENQCIQSCLNIKTQLNRLPKLSRITIDEQVVPIVTLQIPYIKEEFYKTAMSAYIDNIIANADSFKEETERLKYIRNQLSWKRLFSVIVTNMDNIKLNLYKRERIKEQSRYLKYEEAVGSTGQSQGIYIQFLVAVINYISSINSSNADPMGLKKVIFIDNPFGAAKDVYIWEPIFKLLKVNNVQLIVPARGATPAITGRFEVNYILGQKMVIGKQQTVVVDYRSQTESEEMEYVSLDFEQATFDFS
jgi:hypothetical protein